MKKYQVFVSSTYEDLREERQKAIDALLRLGCFPVGMEHFNASDQSQWDVIRKLIEECDYYILIIAGRYGSIDKETDLSYTQKEFRYAAKLKIPILVFVRNHIESLPFNRLEEDAVKRAKLQDFIKEATKDRMCNYWETPDRLATLLSVSMASQIKENPRMGWLKVGDYMLHHDMSDIESWEEYRERGFQYANLRNIDVEKRKHEEILALRAYSMAIIYIPDGLTIEKGELYVWRGSIHKRLGRLKEAENDLNLGVSLFLSKGRIINGQMVADAYYNLACVYAMQDNRLKFEALKAEIAKLLPNKKDMQYAIKTFENRKEAYLKANASNYTLIE